jgi:hypothetical protein
VIEPCCPNENKKGGRIRLIEIDQLLKNKSENFNYIDKTNELDEVKRNIAKDTK